MLNRLVLDIYRWMGNGRSGELEMAADLAKRAASVSHDGEAIFGAQAIAAMKLKLAENKSHELIVAISDSRK